MIVVLAGDCAVEIDGSAPVNLKPFDTVSVEAGTWHRFLSTGDTGFTLLAIYDAERVERTLRDSGKHDDRLAARSQQLGFGSASISSSFAFRM